jgi:hypothetical protein
MQIRFPFPSWATRADEVPMAATEDDVFSRFQGD